MTDNVFLVGERVAVRDYLSKNKWQFGVVEERVGELHYNVILDDGRRWKRHTDQMRKVNVETSEPVTKGDPVSALKTDDPNDAVTRRIPQLVLQESVAEKENIPSVEPETEVTPEPDYIEDAEQQRPQRERRKPMRYLE